MTLLCQGPKQAEGYRISKVGSPEPMDKEEQITPGKTNTLNFTEMTTDKTGLYHCSYQRGGRWSQFSDPLQLVMTGEWDKEAAELGLTPLPREGPGFEDRKQEDQALSLGRSPRRCRKTSSRERGTRRGERQEPRLLPGDKKGQCIGDPSLHH